MKLSLQINPDNQPASEEQIKEWRDFHEVSPVNTTYGLFDSDQKSDERMARSIRNWQHLQTLNEQGELLWKRGDNSILPVTQLMLEQIYGEVDIARTARASVLHYKAAVFAAQDPRPTVKQLKDINFWMT